MRGIMKPLSPGRRLLVDYTAMADATTKGLVTRRMPLGPLVAARAEAAAPRPAWPAMMAKAWALVARDHPGLRRLYVQLPWPHIYEVPASICAVVMEREVDGEPALFLARVKNPDTRDIAALGQILRELKVAPVETVKDFRSALLIARLPQPLRRLAWWIGQNVGRQRPNFLGTFGLTVLGGEGADIVYPVSIWTTLVTYGLVQSDGEMEVRCAFDHRVLDGVAVARALADLQTVLLGAILEEVRALPLANAAPNG